MLKVPVKRLKYKLTKASQHGNLERVTQLITDYLLDHCLVVSSMYGQDHVVEYLLNHAITIGKSVRIDDYLSIASSYGHVYVILLLLNRGANIHAGYDEPLRKAIKYKHSEAIKTLITYGANVTYGWFTYDLQRQYNRLIPCGISIIEYYRLESNIINIDFTRDRNILITENQTYVF